MCPGGRQQGRPKERTGGQVDRPKEGTREVDRGAGALDVRQKGAVGTGAAGAKSRVVGHWVEVDAIRRLHVG